MKNILLFAFSVLLLCAACGDDDEAGGNANDLAAADLHYDGDNFSAPIIGNGTHLMAARLTANDLAEYQGKTLEEVLFYLQDVPATCELLVMAQNTATEPGAVLFGADVTDFVNANGWNPFTLDPPVAIPDGEDLWIGVRVEHNGDTQSVGCDEGPAQANGDWILSSITTSWETFRDFTAGESSINWNIRARVSD